jgi:C1A family cysteine protease
MFSKVTMPLMLASAGSPPAPAMVDLRKWFPGIRDQGSEGSCTGQATSACREVLYGSYHNQVLLNRRSPAYLYARTRMAEGTWPSDAGATMADEFAVLQSYGVCSESDMPYDMDPAEPIPNIADADAAAFRVPTPAWVDMGDPNNAMQVLANGMPIGIAIPVYQSFEDVRSDGRVPMPNPDVEPMLGGHGLPILGYDADKKFWIVANSWGTGWGDSGFCYIPFGYPMWEAWTAPKS